MGRLDFLYRMDLPHRAVSVYTYLADRANKDGECWPANSHHSGGIKAVAVHCPQGIAGFTKGRAPGN